MKNLLLSLTIIVLGLNVASAQLNTPKFSGLIFGDYFYNASSRNSSNKDLNGFQFRRVYITTDYTLSDNFVSRFRLDANELNDSPTEGGKIGVIVKDAWLLMIHMLFW